MIHNLSDHNSIFNQFIAEIRDINIQSDSMRFRKNLERMGEIFAYEISKTLEYKQEQVTTPLGVADCRKLISEPVIATILRAGLPLHMGILNYFDKAQNAFVGAYRRHHKDQTFEIALEYLACPDLNGKVLIICDPMLATGSSMVLTLKSMLSKGKPKHIHIVTAIASRDGVEYIKANIPAEDFTLWCGVVDEELTAKSYIVPGLGDAGDLGFGSKL
jgi:uracil phosphoribosyltransferase